MWKYEKKLQYPVNIKKPDARMAQVIISQLGGPDGELSASLRYLNQRYSMPYSEVTGLLTDIGTEELAHVEMISAMLYQLTKDLSIDEIKKSGFDKYFVDIKSGRSVIFYYTENNWFHCAGAYMLKHIQSDKCIVNAIYSKRNK